MFQLSILLCILHVSKPRVHLQEEGFSKHVEDVKQLKIKILI